MPTRDELYPSQWLKAADVDPPITATIDRCTIETVGQGTKAERKPVLHFRHDTPKPCVLNRTNFDILITLTGHDDCDDWGGTVVELYAIDVMGPNGPTRGVRIRRPRRRPAQKPIPVVTSKVDRDEPIEELSDSEVL
jgi:hypothetical protein